MTLDSASVLRYSSHVAAVGWLAAGSGYCCALTRVGKQHWQDNLLQRCLDFGFDPVPCSLGSCYCYRTACGQEKQLLPKRWTLALLLACFGFDAALGLRLACLNNSTS